MNPDDEGAARAHFLVGPTAAGKTEVAHVLAERLHWGVLSADAMQVYRGMDRGTAKLPESGRGSVPYWGLDLVDPTERFSAGAFLRHARVAFAESGSRPLAVVGGTGLYVKALLYGLDTPIGEHAAARGVVHELYAEAGVAGLQEELRRLAPARYDSLADPRNPRRLMRALELVLAGSSSGSGRAWTEDAHAPMVGLTLERSALWERIRRRTVQMYEDGLIEEVEGLLLRHGGFSVTAGAGIGYAEALSVLRGERRRDEAIERTYVRTRQLAKRQMTWFRRQHCVRWIDVGGQPVEVIADQVRAHWEEDGPAEVQLA